MNIDIDILSLTAPSWPVESRYFSACANGHLQSAYARFAGAGTREICKALAPYLVQECRDIFAEWVIPLEAFAMPTDSHEQMPYNLTELFTLVFPYAIARLLHFVVESPRAYEGLLLAYEQIASMAHDNIFHYAVRDAALMSQCAKILNRAVCNLEHESGPLAVAVEAHRRTSGALSEMLANYIDLTWRWWPDPPSFEVAYCVAEQIRAGIYVPQTYLLFQALAAMRSGKPVPTYEVFFSHKPEDLDNEEREATVRRFKMMEVGEDPFTPKISLPLEKRAPIVWLIEAQKLRRYKECERWAARFAAKPEPPGESDLDRARAILATMAPVEIGDLSRL